MEDDRAGRSSRLYNLDKLISKFQYDLEAKDLIMVWIMALLIGLNLTGCDFLKRSTPLSLAEYRQYQSCQSDDECVYAQNGPCDCNNGGENISVNKSNLQDFEKLFKSVPCTMRGGPWCKDGIAKCEDKLCHWKKNTPKMPNIDPDSNYPPPPPPPP